MESLMSRHKIIIQEYDLPSQICCQIYHLSFKLAAFLLHLHIFAYSQFFLLLRIYNFPLLHDNYCCHYCQLSLLSSIPSILDLFQLRVILFHHLLLHQLVILVKIIQFVWFIILLKYLLLLLKLNLCLLFLILSLSEATY